MTVTRFKAAAWTVLAGAWLTVAWISVDGRIASERFNRCVAAIVEDNVTSTQTRSQLAELDRMALKQVFLDVANSASREQTLAALTRYNNTVAANEELRVKAKIPEPPSRACD